MRIAFFSDNFYPELSGITDTIVTTGKELTKRGHAVCYVAPRYARADYDTARLPYPGHPEEDTIEGIPIVRLPAFHVPSPTGQSRFAFPSGSSFAFLTTFKPDCIHTQSPYGVGWEAVRAAKHFTVPLIGTNHTAIEDFWPLSGVMRAYDARYYNHCCLVTTPYQALITRMREKGLNRSARVVANPVETALFHPPLPQEKREQKRQLDCPGPTLFYSGRLGREKNLDMVFRAVARLVPKFPTLLFAFTGHGAAEAQLMALARELHIEENVRFLGFIPTEDLARFYQAADVFPMMSTSDSQSIALMRAYASGVPAVCARARGLPDYTPSDCGFLVEPGDYRALAEHLTTLLGDDALRARMGEAAVAYVKQFSPETIALEWEQVFTEALRSPQTS
ncbi:MAG: glycosyltransferase [Patescibacteria group bacterium]